MRGPAFDRWLVPPATTLALRDQPGWVTFGIDGHAYPSTGEVFDTRTKKLVTAMKDETGRVGSEKLLEVVFESGKPVCARDQFGMGGKR